MEGVQREKSEEAGGLEGAVGLCELEMVISRGFLENILEWSLLKLSSLMHDSFYPRNAIPVSMATEVLGSR